MAYYIAGTAIVLLLVLPARRYFGKKYAGTRRCGGCQGCPYAKGCASNKK